MRINLWSVTSAALFACSVLPSARADSLVTDAQFETVGLTAHWDARLPLASHERVKQVWLIEDALYVATTNGALYAFKADVGLLRWAVKVTEPGYRIGKPAHMRLERGADVVLVTATDAFHVLDRFSGETHQRFTSRFPAGGAAVGRGNMIFVGGEDAHVYSLLLGFRRLPQPPVLWTVRVAGPVTANLVLYGADNLVFASQGGIVYSCRARDKALNWYYATGGPILGDPVVDAGGIYVASHDRSLYKFDKDRGRVLWRVRLPGALSDGPSVTAHTVFQHCPGRGVVAIDAASGKEKWWVEGGLNFVAHDRDRDVVFCEPGTLRTVDHESGRLFSTVELPGVELAVENVLDDAVYLLSAEGSVVCARMASVPYLRLQQILAAQEQLRQNPSSSVPPIEETGLRRPVESDPFRSRRDGGPNGPGQRSAG